MDQQQLIKDWYIRYHSIFKTRYTVKRKDKFLQSLEADVKQFRSDTKVDHFKFYEKSATEYRNLYIGNIKKAKVVFSTYYDTPSAHIDAYKFFDIESRKRNKTKLILVSSMLYLLVGLAITLFIAMPIFKNYDTFSWQFISMIVGIVVYFFFLGKITQGWPSRHNLVQNTSSLLALLLAISSMRKNKQVAYAFLDAGCLNNGGLDRLREETSAKIYHLDSIGSPQELHLLSTHDALYHLISAEKIEANYQLSKQDLNSQQLNEANMNQVLAIIEQVSKEVSR